MNQKISAMTFEKNPGVIKRQGIFFERILFGVGDILED